jgi:hypothetical protein
MTATVLGGLVIDSVSRCIFAQVVQRLGLQVETRPTHGADNECWLLQVD